MNVKAIAAAVRDLEGGDTGISAQESVQGLRVLLKSLLESPPSATYHVQTAPHLSTRVDCVGSMTANRLIELMNRTPFEPLDIRLNDGMVITVEHPYQVATKRKSATCTIYDEYEDKMPVVAFRNIAEVVTTSV